MSDFPISQDLDFLFELNEFAQWVTQGINPAFKGILTDFYSELSGGTVGIEGAEVLLIAKTLDVSGFNHGTILTISSDDYIIVNTRPDNTGLTRLQLARA